MEVFNNIKQNVSATWAEGKYQTPDSPTQQDIWAYLGLSKVVPISALQGTHSGISTGGVDLPDPEPGAKFERTTVVIPVIFAAVHNKYYKVTTLREWR